MADSGSVSVPCSMRRGQLGTYLKPLLVLLFMVLLVFLFVEVMNFQTDLKQDRSEINFQQEVRHNMQDVVDCLRVDPEHSGSSFVLNRSKLEAFEQQYRLREPPCAEDMQYGYEVTVEEMFLAELKIDVEVTGVPVDTVIAIDDSSSMGDDMSAVKNNVRDYMEQMPDGSRVGMFTFATPCHTSEEFRGW